MTADTSTPNAGAATSRFAISCILTRYAPRLVVFGRCDAIASEPIRNSPLRVRPVSERLVRLICAGVGSRSTLQAPAVHRLVVGPFGRVQRNVDGVTLSAFVLAEQAEPGCNSILRQSASHLDRDDHEPYLHLTVRQRSVISSRHDLLPHPDRPGAQRAR